MRHSVLKYNIMLLILSYPIPPYYHYGYEIYDLALDQSVSGYHNEIYAYLPFIM